MNKKLFSSSGLVLLAVVTLIAIGFFNSIGKFFRIDLTENQLYTVSEGSKSILTSLERPVDLYLFFTNEQTKNIPALRNYARRVEDLLREYVLLSGGRLTLHKVDPEPFSEDEDKAAEFGLQAVPIAIGGDEIYFGMAAENADGDREIIEFFHPDKEAFLEYEISQMVYRLSNPNPIVVGVMSNLSVQGGFDMARQAATPPWTIMDQIEQVHEVRTVSTTSEAIEEDIDILMVIHPKGLTAQTEYAIDQFVLRGGKAMIFVDPLAEMDQAGSMMGMGGAGSLDKASDLDTLFQQWGIEMADGEVLGDAKHALRVSTGRTSRPQTHLGLLSLTADNMATESVITDQLESINIGNAGILKPLDGAQTAFNVLLSSSDRAMPLSVEAFQMLSDLDVLKEGFQPTGERYAIAAQVSGVVQTAFPEGKPEPETSEESDAATPPPEEGDEKGDQPVHLSTSNGPINVIVIADTDILTDRLWVRVQDFFGQRIAVPWANNSDFLINALDALTGSADLISVRSRGRYARPFEVVETLQREAEARFRAKEKELQLRLQETEAKLSELQRPPEEGQQVLTLSPEQERALVSFQEEKLKIRKALRDVRHQLDRDIRTLGVKLKLYNIVAVPLLLTLFALLFSWKKRQRRRMQTAA